jgi:hypothetical protein
MIGDISSSDDKGLLPRSVNEIANGIAECKDGSIFQVSLSPAREVEQLIIVVLLESEKCCSMPTSAPLQLWIRLQSQLLRYTASAYEIFSATMLQRKASQYNKTAPAASLLPEHWR